MRQMSGVSGGIGVSVLFLAAFLSLLTACGSGDDAGQANGGDQEVVTERFTPRAVTVLREYPGRLRGIREIEVRARVGGILIERLYEEGAHVDKGAPLFQIDPVPYEIAHRRALAERDTAKAMLSQALREWERISELHKQGNASTSARDRALADRDLADAGLALAEAGLAAAALDLEWARVTAPIGGMTGLEAHSEGTLVAEGALLTTVVQLDPIQVRFSVPEIDALRWRAAHGAARPGHENAADVVELLPQGEDTILRRGRIDFMGSTVDAGTGTVAARAVFENSDGRLIPGQFVRVRLPLERLSDVIVIPEDVVSQSSEGPRVFVVDNAGRVQSRPVRLGPVVAEGQVILDGVSSADPVVVEGHAVVQEGMSVSVTAARNVSGPDNPVRGGS